MIFLIAALVLLSSANSFAETGYNYQCFDAAKKRSEFAPPENVWIWETWILSTLGNAKRIGEEGFVYFNEVNRTFVKFSGEFGDEKIQMDIVQSLSETSKNDRAFRCEHSFTQN